MRYSPISSELFKANRKNLLKLLKPNSVVILTSNDVMPTNADGMMGFRQNSDIFYLTGIDQEDTFLVLAPQHPNERFRELLFVKETNEHIAVWEGKKLDKSEAKAVSGVERVYWSQQFESVLESVIFESENIYLNTNEHKGSQANFQSNEDRLVLKIKDRYPLHTLQRLAPLMHHLRLKKHKIEVELLRNAINITEKMFYRATDFAKAGVWEFEIEAEITHELIKSRSRYHAYQPIIAAGKNSCVLHYVDNNAQCQDGDLILMDIGAEYANYNADLTRTIPVSGRFTARQKQVYNAVLRVLKGAKKLIVAGNVIDKNQELVGQMMEKELLDLGLLTKDDIKKNPYNGDNPALKKYFPHGISHFLGLDVHDVGSRYRRFEAGMVLTCEPGIYIKEEGFGIRLENDILVTSTGNIDLMAHIPIEAEEIEDLMNPN